MSDIKRLNYFIGQFLTAQDFLDEQAYQIGQRRRANRLRFGPGILDGGFLVKPGQTVDAIEVGPGTAIDREGQEIVLRDPRTLDIKDLPKGDRWVVITYQDYRDEADKRKDGEFEDVIRITECVWITLKDAPPAGDRVGLDLVVARITVTVDADNNRQVDIHNDAPLRQPSRLRSLDTEEAFAATIRAADLWFGYSGRSGGPKRALVDIGKLGPVTGKNGLIINDQDSLDPGWDYVMVKGDLFWGSGSALRVDQNGSLELGGGSYNIGSTRTPFIDFHYKDGEDFNTRIINDGDGLLSIMAPKLRVSGNVGIGTLAPAYALHLKTDWGFLALDSNQAGQDAGLRLMEGGAVKWHLWNAAGDKKLYLARDGLSPSLTIDADGKVGIGTKTPSAGRLQFGNELGNKLVVWDGGQNDRYGFGLNGGNLNAFVPTGGRFSLRQNGYDGNEVFSVAGTGDVALKGDVDIGGTGAIRCPLRIPDKGLQIGIDSSDATRNFHLVADGAAGQRGLRLYKGNWGSGTHLLTVLSDGKVGIGTTTPTAKLEVAGGGGSSIDFLVNGRLRSNNNDGGLWIAEDRFIGGHSTDQVGFWNGNAWRLTVQKDGNVGIGTTAPKHPLHLKTGWGFLALDTNQTGQDAGLRLMEGGAVKWHLWNAAVDKKLYLARDGLSPSLTIDADGRVGIGTTTPSAGRLQFGNELGNKLVVYDTGPTDRYGFGLNSGNLNAFVPTGGRFSLRQNDYNGTEVFSVDSGGSATMNGALKVIDNLGTSGYGPGPSAKHPTWHGIQTWDVEANGTIWCANSILCKSGQMEKGDLAENYFSDQPLEPGDVVSLDPVLDRIVRSAGPDDRLVCGVISTDPGVLLNSNAGEHQSQVHPVALAGRVPCKVVAENGPISRGDLLTTSSSPGYAMSAAPWQDTDGYMDRRGAIIGKALGQLEAGSGVIEILVCLG